MWLSVEHYGDVTRLRMASAAGRVAGVDVSAYVIRGVMIDCGFHRARRAVIEAISSLHVQGVLLTHWHEDHAGNAEALASRGIPIAMRADTESALRSRPHIELYRKVIWGHPPALASAIAPFAAQDMECLHTPGHSEDHQIVWYASSGTLFSGDLWLGVRVRVMHADENPHEILASLRRAAALAPSRMFDAHRGRVERPVKALEARAEWLAETIGQIERRIAEGWSDSQILKRVLGGEEQAGYISYGNYARVNLVKAVRKLGTRR